MLHHRYEAAGVILNGQCFLSAANRCRVMAHTMRMTKCLPARR
jgi:hypothetical protein